MSHPTAQALAYDWSKSIIEGGNSQAKSPEQHLDDLLNGRAGWAADIRKLPGHWLGLEATNLVCIAR